MNYPTGLHIPRGLTLSPPARCKGLFLIVNGDLIVDGGVSMTARGAYASGADTDLEYIIRRSQTRVVNRGQFARRIRELLPVAAGSVGTVPAVGAAGGSTSAAAGTAGTDRKTGGGGAGTAYDSVTFGKGGAGTSFSGGSGGGAADKSNTPNNGSSIGGPGGAAAGTYYNLGGGAGNPGGSPHMGGSAGGTGTGGLVFILVRGNITITATGAITADGVAGGWGTGGGGGSGGGSINIAYTGTYSNAGTVRANGGGSSGVFPGGAGGAGCITIEQVTL